VTALCPGPTRTEFEGRAGSPDEILARKEGFVMSASDVARDGWRGMKAGKRLVVPGLKNRLLIQAERITPRRLVTAMSRRIREPHS
jgi:short-subunit dehydrogenase